MDWTDDAIVLSARKHGENATITTLLTRERGVHAGLVRGGAGKRLRGLQEPGNWVEATWRARLAEHLGAYTLELRHAYAAEWLSDAARLAALSAACALSEGALPEREPHPAVYEGLKVLLDSLGDAHWAAVYVSWELGLLKELGFGLDLTCCAATGEVENLTYVSPKSGRAVSQTAGAPYRDRLLELPAFLVTGEAPTTEQLHQGLRLSEFFLAHCVFQPHGKTLPRARARLHDVVKGKPL